MSSLKRMLSVLDGFSPQEPVLGVDAVMERLGLTRGTAYRYLRELCGAGLLARLEGGFALGPRIIELDYAIRQCDPALRAAQPVMRDLREQFDCDVLLTGYFDGRVIVSHHERGGGPITMSYGRGRQMPLFYGCGSKMILASLPRPRQRRLYQSHGEEIAAAGLGRSWTEFRGVLDRIRRAGHSVSVGELDQGNVGVAAPLGRDPVNAPASVVLVFAAARYAIIDKELVIEILKAAAERVSRTIDGRQASGDEVVRLVDRRSA